MWMEREYMHAWGLYITRVKYMLLRRELIKTYRLGKKGSPDLYGIELWNLP